MSVIADLLDRVPRLKWPWRAADAEASEVLIALQRAIDARQKACSFTIVHYDGPNNTPAYSLALRGHMELTESGLGPPCTVLNWDQQVISAEINGECIGVILWEHAPHTKTVFIYLGYVHPDHRAKGVYRAMWDALVVKAQEKGAVLIRGETDMKNAVMRATAARLGRVERTIGLVFDVSPQQKTRPM